MSYLISNQLVKEVNQMEEEIYQCDDDGLSNADRLIELEASNDLNDYIRWMEDEIEKRRLGRLINIEGACYAIN